MIKFSDLRNYSSLLVLIYDTLAVMGAWLGAYFVDHDLRFSLMDPNTLTESLESLVAVLVLQLSCYWFFRTYRPLLRFSSFPELMRLCKAVLVGWVLSLALFEVLGDRFQIPRAVWVMYPLLLISALVFARLGIRYLKSRQASTTNPLRVLLIGAGTGAELFLREISHWPDKKYKPIVALDDDLSLKGKEIRGVPIVGSTDLIAQVVKRYKIEMIVIAIPSIQKQPLKRILNRCEDAQLPVRILPGIDEITAGSAAISDLRAISLEDLLGRDPVKLDSEPVKQFLQGEVVLVTGGGGSIGSELCRQISQFAVKEIIVADQSEFNLYEIERELHKRGFKQVRPILLDVTDKAAVEHLFAQYCPQIVFHAAAYKHVPMLEPQVREAVYNNVLGTQILAEAAVRHHVKKVIMVSSDKAVNPTNVMGATKRIAEIYCQTLNHQQHHHTRFITVRFGNVIGSAGSVIPLFKEQLAEGGPITVTHPDIMRYFMTIPEASQLILQAGAMGEGGEIFVLDMGEPIKIADLAKQLIRLAGKTEHEIEIQYTGLRPGEKLFEELFYETEPLLPTHQEKILKASSVSRLSWDELSALFERFEKASQTFEDLVLRKTISDVLQHEAVGLEKIASDESKVPAYV